MINYNGDLIDFERLPVRVLERSAKYGDAVFETIRMREGKLLFIEDHYFRLMASMRILRMDIPMSFTPEYFVEQAGELAEELGISNGRLRLQVVRHAGGRYTPEGPAEALWWMELEPLEETDYQWSEKGLTVDLYKDHYIQAGLLSTLKSANSLLPVLAGIYAKENNLDAVLMVNDKKMLVEANWGNVFVVQGDKLRTAPLEAGALRGVFRKNLLEWAKDLKLELIEEEINPFDLQRADEVWITNTIRGIQWVETYRKKTFVGTKAKEAIDMINRKLHVLGTL